jgi:hypothetical protein
MHYDFAAIPDADVPATAEPVFQHLVVTYASETNKSASVWRAVPDRLLDFKPHQKVNTVRRLGLPSNASPLSPSASIPTVGTGTGCSPLTR